MNRAILAVLIALQLGCGAAYRADVAVRQGFEEQPSVVLRPVGQKVGEYEFTIIFSAESFGHPVCVGQPSFVFETMFSHKNGPPIIIPAPAMSSSAEVFFGSSVVGERGDSGCFVVKPGAERQFLFVVRLPKGTYGGKYRLRIRGIAAVSNGPVDVNLYNEPITTAFTVL